MPDYNFHGLDPRTFQQLVQAIAVNVIGPGIVVYGDGPDGARDASFQGKTAYPTSAEAWDGYIVIQAKFRQKSSGDHKKETDWLAKQIQSDLDKFRTPSPRYRVPEYYIITTNIDLTATPEVGSDARIRKLLADYSTKLNLKGWDIWDGKHISRHLDGHRDIAITYGGYLMTGDILAKMRDYIEQAQPNFDQIMSEYLQGELVTDQFARLREAGSAAERRTPLARVFIDLPTAREASTDPPHEGDEQSRLLNGFAQEVLHIGALRMDRKSIIDRRTETGSPRDISMPEDGRLVLLGGPGQGKSTLGQFICQLYRTALLKDRPQECLSEYAIDALHSIRDQCIKDSIPLPSARRFPVRIDLKYFADDLATRNCISLIDYIAQRIDHRSSEQIDRNVLQKWLASYPWLLILDGLDEVPSSGNRAEVLDCIAQFSTQCSTRGADILIIATSRPQGYGDAFQSHLYCHRHLLPLSTQRALHYSQRLVEACHQSDPTLREEILARLERAANEPTTQRLLRSPLQVTILAVLAELGGELPKDRWELFRRYYGTIFDRETQRGVALSAVLRKYRNAIDQIHKRVGLQLQATSEITGQNNSVLSRQSFSSIVYSEIEELGGTPDQCNYIADQLTEAALQRLVFLVSPRGDDIGFEIRSLQEFMAAEALMDGQDDLLRKRLETIAPFPYWRNVFLFAAGKCTIERRYLVPIIVNICQTLNDPSNPPASITMAGSRLALDLLEDDTFRSQPKQHRALGEIALRLLELPSEESHWRLAEVYSSGKGLEPIYEAALRRMLSMRDLSTQLGAWTTLTGLIAAGHTWATPIADDFWPQAQNEQTTIAYATSRSRNNPFLASKLTELVPCTSPGDLLYNTISPEGPSWLMAAERLLHGRVDYTSLAIHTELPLGVPFHLGLVRFNSIAKEHWAQIKQIPSPSPQWLPVISNARLILDPSREAVARELMLLANSAWTPDEHIAWKWQTSWPLATILSFTKSKDELRTLARKISVGEFESPGHWSQYETEWLERGAFFSDVFVDQNIPPQSLRTAWINFPMTFPASTEANIIELLHFFVSQYNQKFPPLYRAHLAILIVESLKYTLDMYGPTPLQELGVSISPTSFKDLILESQTEWLPAEIVLSSIASFPLSPEWIDVLDLVGNRLRLYLDAAEDFALLAQAILESYLLDPSRTGLLAWLACFAEHEVKFTIPNRQLVSAPSKLSLREHFHLTIIELAQGALTTEGARNLAVRLASNYAGQDWFSPTTLYGPLTQHIATPWALVFIQELIQRIPSMSGVGISLLQQVLRVQQSPLHLQSCLADLGLLDILGTLIASQKHQP